MCSEGYSIIWNGHGRNVGEVFGRYLDENNLVDCTIAAEGKYVKAHQLMLSACSPYFELLFRQEKKKNPIVILKDIKFEDLKCLIMFVYQGRVTIPKDRLKDFVDVAESLQIKGLQRDLLNNNSQRETCELSVIAKESSASHLPLKCMRCSAVDAETSSTQCENLNSSSVDRKQSGDGRESTCMHIDLSKENVNPPQESAMESDSRRQTAVFPSDKESSVEPKEEIDVEDTPIWESEEENISTVTGLPTAGEENQSESPVDTASTSPSVSDVPTEQDGGAMEDSVMNNSETKAAMFPTGKESSGEPKEKIDVENTPIWESEDEIETNSGSIHYQENTSQDVDVSSSSDNTVLAASPSVVNEAFPSSSMASQSNEKEVNTQVMKTDGLEMNKQHKEMKCKSIEINGSMIDQIAKRGLHGVVDEDKVGKEEHVIKRRGMMVVVLERALEAKFRVEQSEDVDDITPLSRRISKMSGKKSYKCVKCTDVFHSVYRLKVHIKEVHGKECLNRCEICLATFTLSSDLRRHMMKHTGERPFQCDVCKMYFSRKSYLITHIRKHTGERPFHCNVCKMSFNHNGNLKRHKQTHLEERPFKCDVCEMTFSLNCSLTAHMRRHTGKSPFQCEVCKVPFRDKYDLFTHMRKHTGERPFKCDVCQKSFTQGNNLTKHMLKHTGENPFQCDVCKKSFTRSGLLTKHMWKHAGERPFQCDVCKFSFRYQSNLSRHMQKHKDESLFLS